MSFSVFGILPRRSFQRGAKCTEMDSTLKWIPLHHSVDFAAISFANLLKAIITSTGLQWNLSLYSIQQLHILLLRAVLNTSNKRMFQVYWAIPLMCYYIPLNLKQSEICLKIGSNFPFFDIPFAFFCEFSRFRKFEFNQSIKLISMLFRSIFFEFEKEIFSQVLCNLDRFRIF